MIVTVTLNPAIDYIVHAELPEIGKTCRSSAEEIRIGGKGINVSFVLAALNFPSIALGFTAGFTGTQIENGIKSDLILSDFVRLPKGISRINIKIMGKTETEINASGPTITEKEASLLLEKIDHLQNGDTLVIAGALPPGAPKDMYQQILKRIEKKDIRVAVDTTKNLLWNTLRYHPFLIKPNLQELCDLFHTQIQIGEIPKYAMLLKQEGAQNVLVSLGERGSFLLDNNGETHYRTALTGQVKNTVGAGDSMVAGFLAGYEKTHDFGSAFLLANACGAAAAFSSWLADKPEIEACLSAFSKDGSENLSQSDIFSF